MSLDIPKDLESFVKLYEEDDNAWYYISTGDMQNLFDEALEKISAKDAEIAELRKLLAELTDPDECRYDHHGYCQTHSLQEYPCPHSRAKELLEQPKKGA